MHLLGGQSSNLHSISPNSDPSHKEERHVLVLRRTPVSHVALHTLQYPQDDHDTATSLASLADLHRLLIKLYKNSNRN